VEFTGVKLSGGAELVAPVEKDAPSPMEKAMAGPRALEGRGGREAWWRGRKMGCYALARWRCWLAKRRSRGEGGAVESSVTKAAQACGGAGVQSIFFLSL
jgi:hypothetical protein